VALSGERSKTLYIEDCEHDISYQGDRITEYLDPTHSYKATQITVDAYDQRCDVCGRAEQAQFRVTFVNLTRDVTLYMGRICLKKETVKLCWDMVNPETLMRQVLCPALLKRRFVVPKPAKKMSSPLTSRAREPSLARAD